MKKLCFAICLLSSLSFCSPTDNIHSDWTKQVFAHDKLDHMIYSAYLYKVAKDQWGQEKSMAAVLTIGILKETYDYYFGTTGFDLLDLSADGVGIVLGGSF